MEIQDSLPVGYIILNKEQLFVQAGTLTSKPKSEIITYLTDLVIYLNNDPKIKTLKILANAIEDITPLRELKFVETLWVRGNTIKDAAPLTQISTLKMVDFKGNDPDVNVLPLVTKGINVGGSKASYALSQRF